MSYSYTTDRNYDKWEALEDHYVSMLDELYQESEDDSDVFVDVEDFDLEEVL